MLLELNNYGFVNLIKPDFIVNRIMMRNPNVFKMNVNFDELTNFLSLNELSLNDKNQITDGSNVFGFIEYLN